jgi:hypothetical protein
MDTKQFILFLVVIPLLAQSQVSQNARYISDIVDPSMINTELFYEGKYKEISGSPYLEKEMKKGVIILKDNRKVEDVMIRYNAYEDALMYQIEEDKVTLLDPPVINGFEYHKNDKVFKYISISILEGKRHFYEVIYEGKSTLVVQHRIKLTEKTNNAGSYGASDMQGSAFKQSDIYFLMDTTGKSSEVNLTKKSLISALGSHAEELQTFIKKNKLKVKENTDLIRLLEYYDSLE